MYIALYKMFTVTRAVKQGLQWKVYTTHYRTKLLQHFFCEHVITPWHSLKIIFETLQSVAAFQISVLFIRHRMLLVDAPRSNRIGDRVCRSMFAEFRGRQFSLTLNTPL